MTGVCPNIIGQNGGILTRWLAALDPLKEYRYSTAIARVTSGLPATVRVLARALQGSDPESAHQLFQAAEADPFHVSLRKDTFTLLKALDPTSLQRLDAIVSVSLGSCLARQTGRFAAHGREAVAITGDEVKRSWQVLDAATPSVMQLFQGSFQEWQRDSFSGHPKAWSQKLQKLRDEVSDIETYLGRISDSNVVVMGRSIDVATRQLNRMKRLLDLLEMLPTTPHLATTIRGSLCTLEWK